MRWNIMSAPHSHCLCITSILQHFLTRFYTSSLVFIYHNEMWSRLKPFHHTQGVGGSWEIFAHFQKHSFSASLKHQAWYSRKKFKLLAYFLILVRGNPWESVINLGKSFLLILTESIGNLGQENVGYPSRKGVHHIYLMHPSSGGIPNVFLAQIT